jgi:NADPH-dependent 2,4-dienoyl-CoA reductase/sulfur reductase-like enzyme
VPVDENGRTAIDNVLAAGDAAATYDPELDQHVPGSHWEAAGRQGARAARVMLGLPPGPAPLTSFWTDQYGIRIHYLGRARRTDSVTIDGDPGARNFTATFIRAGRPVAALLVDRGRSLPAARSLIAKEPHELSG